MIIYTYIYICINRRPNLILEPNLILGPRVDPGPGGTRFGWETGRAGTRAGWDPGRVGLWPGLYIHHIYTSYIRIIYILYIYIYIKWPEEFARSVSRDQLNKDLVFVAVIMS